MERAAATLSGGEAQRIRLATQIGSSLVGVLYILDEPSIGLHQRDNERLIATLERLRDLGNTVLVVEHDEGTMRAADHLIDIGPGAGEHGGYVIAQGTADEVERAPESLTGQYLSGARAIRAPEKRRTPSGYVEIVGATQHNLKSVNVKLPLGTFTCVTGVSGSGKSTLVNEVLYKAVANRLNRARMRPGAHKRIEGLEQLDKVISVDQSPIGRTPRSNPATYIGLFDQIRDLFSKTQEARARGYKAGRFSFNVKGGRCEVCRGDGQIKIEMHFLPDVYVPCEQCHGKRYNRETLDIRFKGKTIADVLEMPIEEALGFFAHIPKIKRRLQTLHDVGLDYMRLGQPATTLSGGEAQRVKLASRARQGRDGADALHPRRADDRPPLRRHREAARGAPAPRRPGQHRRRHRAQPRRHQDRRPAHRHGPGGRGGGRPAHGRRHARGGRGRARVGDGPLPVRAWSSRRRPRRAARRGAGACPRRPDALAALTNVNGGWVGERADVRVIATLASTRAWRRRTDPSVCHPTQPVLTFVPPRTPRARPASASSARRSAAASRPNGASATFPRSSVQIPATMPSTRNVAGIRRFFEISAGRCSSATSRERSWWASRTRVERREQPRRRGHVLARAAARPAGRRASAAPTRSTTSSPAIPSSTARASPSPANVLRSAALAGPKAAR